MHMSYDVWAETFKPKPNPRVQHTDQFETHGEDHEDVLKAYQLNPNTVWTVVEGEEDDSGDDDQGPTNLWIVSGYHYVNRICYFITSIPSEEDEFYEIPW